MNTDEIKVLADLVVNTARQDRTEPEKGNWRSGWRTDRLLTEIDALVVGQNNDPAAYAEIGRQILNQIDGLPEMAMLAKLAIFRGERLLTIAFGYEDRLLKSIKSLDEDIDTLPNGNRKFRCRSLFNYHAGIFYDAYGRFEIAAEAQSKATAEADFLGDRPGAAICQFTEVLCLLKQALLNNKTAEIVVTFKCLEDKFADLVEAVRGSAFEVQWAEANGPMAMIEACVWLNQYHQNWNHWVQTITKAAGKLGQSYFRYADYIKALDLAYHGKWDDGEAFNALVVVTVLKSNPNEVKATASLVLARHALFEGKSDVAKQIIAQMPEPGAQHIRAIAVRLLAQYSGV